MRLLGNRTAHISRYCSVGLFALRVLPKRSLILLQNPMSKEKMEVTYQKLKWLLVGASNDKSAALENAFGGVPPMNMMHRQLIPFLGKPGFRACNSAYEHLVYLEKPYSIYGNFKNSDMLLRQTRLYYAVIEKTTEPGQSKYKLALIAYHRDEHSSSTDILSTNL